MPVWRGAPSDRRQPLLCSFSPPPPPIVERSSDGSGCRFDTFARMRGRDPAARRSAGGNALRLAQAKARAAVRLSILQASSSAPTRWRSSTGCVLDKPGSRDRASGAVAARQRPRGRLPHRGDIARSAFTDARKSKLVPTRVRFRALTASQISAYLDAEQPYDCAGSAKSEGVGYRVAGADSGRGPNGADRLAFDRAWSPCCRTAGLSGAMLCSRGTYGVEAAASAAFCSWCLPRLATASPERAAQSPSLADHSRTGRFHSRGTQDGTRVPEARRYAPAADRNAYRRC